MQNSDFSKLLKRLFGFIGLSLIVVPFAFQIRHHSTSEIAFINLYNVYLMDADGSNLHQLSDIKPGPTEHPSWSPNGKQIAFDAVTSHPAGSSSSNQDIYVINVDDEVSTNITSNDYDDAFPTWSPRGDKIAFVSDRAGNWQLYLMNIDGTQQQRLTYSDADDGIHGLTWSPDGSQIAFVSNRGKNTKTIAGNYEYENIFLIDIPSVVNESNEAKTINLTSAIHQCPAGENYLNPTWSIKNQLAFATQNCGTNWDIAVFNMDDALGNSSSALPYFNLTQRENEDGVLGLSWSPDGSQIIFVANHPEVTQALSEDVFIVDVNETRKTNRPQINQVTNEPDMNNVYSFPSWKPESEVLKPQ
jgi:Tol biopolymer transport system component